MCCGGAFGCLEHLKYAGGDAFNANWVEVAHQIVQAE